MTRVFTFALSRELSREPIRRSASPSTPFGVAPWQRPNKIGQNVKINLYHMGCSPFLEKLQAVPDGDGSILITLIFYGGGMGPERPSPIRCPAAVGGGVRMGG